MFFKRKIKKRKRLNGGTVPPFKRHNRRTGPPFKMHRRGAVPSFKMHPGGTLNFYDIFFKIDFRLYTKKKHRLLRPFLNL